MTREHGAPGARLRATRVRTTRVRATPARASSVLAAVILVSACGSYAATTTTAARTAGRSCPALAPRFRLPAVGAGRAKLVPAGPVTAAVCQYGSGRAARLPRRVLLTGVAAGGLAAVIDSAGLVQPSARRCGEPAHLDPFAQEIIFTY